MWFSIEIDQPSNPDFRTRSFHLLGGSWKVGRDPECEIVVLHPNFPRRAGAFRSQWGQLLWAPQEGTPVNCLKNEVLVGPYRFRGRISKYLKRLGALLCFILLSCSIIAWNRLSESQTSKTPVAATTTTFLPAPDTYGNPKGGGKPSAEFAFNVATPKNLELRFSPGNIRGTDQLEIKLNGRSIAFSSPCPDRWGKEERLPIDARDLIQGKNILTFQNHPAETGGKIWGIRNIYTVLGAKEGAPVETGEEWLQKAKAALEQRSTMRGQIWRANQYLEKAISIWRGHSRAIPVEAEQLRSAIQMEERRMVNRLRSQAKAALSVGDRERADSIYKGLIAEYVDPNDPMREKIEEERREVLQ